MPFPSLVVFVHGWSVRSTSAYGKLPERLRREVKKLGTTIDIRHVWLSKYVSFRDEVKLSDLAGAFQAAIERELPAATRTRNRFACITHSTGGPVVRDWWQRFYLDPGRSCPLSHLIMLAPANFGSALAQLGKGRLSRVKAWFEGVEPGSGVLDWLELGSPESWALNAKWIGSPDSIVEDSGVFPFVLTGQTIDRKLYDHIVPLTGEAGSDGVVRVAAANLNADLVRLEQEPWHQQGTNVVAPRLIKKGSASAPPTAFKVVHGRSHSGTHIGIIRSVKDDGEPHPTVSAVLRCLQVSTLSQYESLRNAFATENVATQQDEQVEIARGLVLPGTKYITDHYSMVIFRLVDDRGYPIEDFDLKLTAVPTSRPSRNPSPDLLPKGFFQHRQQNSRQKNILTYFLDSDAMLGAPELRHNGEKVRDPLPGAAKLGLVIVPHLTKGVVHYLPAELEASPSVLEDFVKPNQTTLVEIVLRRVVHEGVFRLVTLNNRNDKDFSKELPGEPIPQ